MLRSRGWLWHEDMKMSEAAMHGRIQFASCLEPMRAVDGPCSGSGREGGRGIKGGRQVHAGTRDRKGPVTRDTAPAAGSPANTERWAEESAVANRSSGGFYVCDRE